MIEFIPYASLLLLGLIWLRAERTASQISSLQLQVENLRREMGLAPPLSAEPSERVRQLAADPKMTIEAIRTYREESGADFRRAQKVLEQFRQARRAN